MMEQKTRGRPSTFTPDLADQICERLSDGESLRAICRDDDMPSQSMVFRWLAQDNGFREQYKRAREAQAELLFDELLDIADDGRNDWMEKYDKDGKSLGYVINGEHVQRSRLRVDARKWAISKMLPKVYGDRVDLNHGVQPDNPLTALLQMAQGTSLPLTREGDDAADE